VIGKRFAKVGWLVASACSLAAIALADPLVEVTAGCAGGPAGGSYGVTLRSGGEIVRWHKASRHEEPEEVEMRSNPVLTDELIGRLDAIGFEQIEYSKSGDMTCSLSSRSDEREHRVSWPLGDTVVPAGVRELAERIRGLVDDPANSGPPVVE